MWFRTLLDALKPKRSRPLRRAPLDWRPARLAVETLEDRSVPATLSVSDLTFVEGNAGTQNALVTVTLSAPSTQTVRVNYATAAGTAPAGSDYQAVSGRLEFARGVTRQTILVPVFGDGVREPSETVFVNLRNASHATIADGQGVLTIQEDDTVIRIGDQSATEGNDGTTA